MPVENEVTTPDPGTGVQVLGYDSYDPRDVESPSGGPGVEPRSADGPSGPDIKEGQEPPEESLPEFDPRWRDPFEGMLFIGALSKTFRWCGHEFVMRTLNTDEIILVGMLHKEYAGSIGDVKAYQAAMLAASLVKVDGKPLAESLAPEDTEDLLRTKFRVTVSWYPSALDSLYEEYLLLENTVASVMEAMGKVPG